MFKILLRGHAVSCGHARANADDILTVILVGQVLLFFIIFLLSSTWLCADMVAEWPIFYTWAMGAN